MALKAVIDKLEDVAEGLRGEYKPLDGGGFALDVDGLGEGTKHPAVGELVRAKQREATAATTHAAKAKELQAALDKAKEDLHNRLKGKVDQSNLEDLEKSYQQKLLDTTAKHTAELATRDTALRAATVDSQARALATQQGFAVDAGAAELLTEIIQRRLTVEIGSDGKPVTRVLDADGKLSAASVTDLKTEILATPKYHALLSGSQAKGSGATSGSSGGGASDGKIDWLRGDPATLAAAAAKANPLLGG